MKLSDTELKDLKILVPRWCVLYPTIAEYVDRLIETIEELKNYHEAP